MVTMDDLIDARVDTGVPTKADAHAVDSKNKQNQGPGGTVGIGGGESRREQQKSLKSKSVQTRERRGHIVQLHH